MSPVIRNLPALALVFTLLGCAVGRDFIRPDADTLRLGQTKSAQIIEKFGEPRQEGTVTKNDKTVKVLLYGFATTGGKPAREGVVPVRVMSFSFHNDVLVGHEFMSSFAEDHTDFDEKKISEIVKGKTTRPEVTKLLGKPSGYVIYPLIKATTGEAAVYAYSQTSGSPFNPKRYSKTLVCSFDDSGVVTDVEVSSVGTQ